MLPSLNASCVACRTIRVTMALLLMRVLNAEMTAATARVVTARVATRRVATAARDRVATSVSVVATQDATTHVSDATTIFVRSIVSG